MAKNFADNLRPNILFIMADDHSANAVSAYGSILSKVFQTPNIDRLYQEGSKLENFFATNAICTPARASIMTGQYGHINGVRGLNDVFNQVDNVNLAREFQSAGYETALFGKWHLHCTPKYFDQYKILASDGGQGRYINPEFYEGNTDSQPKQIEHAGYVTDIVTDMTLDYLRNRAKKREQAPEKPFFLMCHHKAPHDFWEFADRHKALFDEVDIPVPKSLFEDRSHRSEATRDYGSSVTPRSTVRNLFEDFSAPDYVTGSLQVPEHATFQEKGLATYQKYLKDYLRTVAAIDESVGALYEELERQQILDNTIIIYTSDQGMFLGEHDYQDKRWSFEESLRSPFLVRYPKEIPIGVANSNLMANIDIAPTLMDYAGITVPFTVQGTSQRAMLAGQGSGKEQIYFRYWMHRAHRHDNPAHFGIRTERYKLTFYYGLPLDVDGASKAESPCGWELYDLQEDPEELQNIYETAGVELRKTLQQQLEKARQFYGDTDEQYPELLERYTQPSKE